MYSDDIYYLIDPSIAVTKYCCTPVFQIHILQYSGNPVFQGKWNHLNFNCLINFLKVHQLWPVIPGRMVWELTEAAITDQPISDPKLLMFSL